MAWPNPLQYVPVSTTTSPVTHTAEVAVKRAVRNDAECPSAVAKGKLRSSAPRRIIAANPYKKTRAGFQGVRRVTRSRTGILWGSARESLSRLSPRR